MLSSEKSVEKSKKNMFMSSKLTTSQPDVKLVIKKYKNIKTEKRSKTKKKITIFH